ncbi:MAG TPA: acyl-CoA reductase [Bacteroidia bacterium]|nr:acyl-CoA reductase [Bacteroidia bacterium]
MNVEQRIEAFVKLGLSLKEFTHSFYDDENSEFQKILSQAFIHNPWFTKENQVMALSSISEMLDAKKLSHWVSTSSLLRRDKPQASHPKRIGVIMAGNIPAVGFHDMLCVLITGNILIAKCSSEDKILLKWISKLLVEIEPAFKDQIIFVERMADMDAVIATGSNNSARYFEYYFSKYPHIIRKNRNAVAVFSGNETEEELKNSGKDVFSYFGLGCRNISKLYIPKGYDLGLFFRSIESFSSIMQHNKYMNNFDYHHAVYLLNDIKFLTNNFLIIKEDKGVSTPVSVLNYEFYDDTQSLKKELDDQKEKIQCIVSNHNEIENAIPFGKAQQPELWDYADGVDTLKFLSGLK